MSKSTDLPVLVAEGRDGTKRAHRATCKRVPADHFETLAYTAVNLHQAVAASCCKPTLPQTPNLDALNAEYAAGTTAKDRKAQKAPTQAKATRAQVQYFKNGHPMNRSNNSLSSLAWQATAKITGPDSKRISTQDLRAILTQAGIDPDSTAWAFTLPNGVIVSCAPVTLLESAAS